MKNLTFIVIYLSIKDLTGRILTHTVFTSTAWPMNKEHSCENHDNPSWHLGATVRETDKHTKC